MQVRYNYI